MKYVDLILIGIHTDTYAAAAKIFTCKELNMVNIQANTLDPWLTANIPNTHVMPSKGSSITVAFRIAL